MKWDYSEDEENEEPYKSNEDWYKEIKHLIWPSIVITVLIIVFVIIFHFLF